MSFTYDLGTEIGYLRLRLGDTAEARARFTDEELDFFLTRHGGDPAKALAEAADTLANRLSYQVDVQSGDQIVRNSQQAAAWAKRAAELTEVADSHGVGVPFAGGISRDDKYNRETDSDRVPGAFTRRTHHQRRNFTFLRGSSDSLLESTE